MTAEGVDSLSATAEETNNPPPPTIESYNEVIKSALQACTAPGQTCGQPGRPCHTSHTELIDSDDSPHRLYVVSHYYGCCEPKAEHPVPLLRVLLAELVGTCMIVLIGCGSVCSGLTGAYSGIWQTAAVWGIGVTLAILATAEISGAHLNPAVSVAFWLVRKEAHDMTFVKVCLYIVAQMLGGILGGALNLLFFRGTIEAFERENGIARGDDLSILSAAAFGEYFPNPFLTIDYGGELYQINDVSPAQAVLVEGWGTFVLCAVIFAVTHERNQVLENSCTRILVPFVIGMTVSVLLALYAPITQAGWNPARDFGPRLVAFMAGWDSIAIPGPRNGFWIYIVGPLVGGPLGAAFMESILFGRAIDKGLDRIHKKAD